MRDDSHVLATTEYLRSGISQERTWLNVRLIGDCLRHRHALYHAHRHGHSWLVHAWHQHTDQP
jgi:hypothetical protein